MPAFSSKTATLVDGSIRSLFSRVQKFFQCELKPDDVKRMVIRPEDIEVLDRAYALIYGTQSSGGTHNFQILLPWKDVVTGVKVTLTCNSGFNFLIPNYVDGDRFIPPECETRSKIESWVHERVEHGIEWGRVLEVFRYLQERCTSPQQLRFYFPGIVTLLVNSGDAKLEKLASKLRSARMPNEFLSLNREAKDYIAAANATLATSQLFLQGAQPATPDCRPSVYAGNLPVDVKCPLDGTRQVLL